METLFKIVTDGQGNLGLQWDGLEGQDDKDLPIVWTSLVDESPTAFRVACSDLVEQFLLVTEGC